jgi:serine/threonine protein kinase
MVDFLNFSHYGYRIERELGANRPGGRVTYLATDIDLGQKVVIKQFQFARQSSNWSEYDAIEREIAVLRDLKHPGIPRYLNSFQTADGFCIVQEYKAAEPLSKDRSFSPEELKIIASKILEILVYLQNRIPPVIHRDLKPDNILVDQDLNLFLVDFGFARVGDGEVGVSSVVKGTLGFMPPEQLFNRQLTEASDLYGLGMTLICLLTHTKPDDIGSLVDISYKVKFKHLVPKINVHWVKWLEKLTEPRVNDRFPNAREALKAIPAISLHPPEVQFSQSEVNLQAERIGQTITHNLEISNLVPEVVLTGKWEVQKNPQDPSLGPNKHAWISVDPIAFESNRIRCRITVETNPLMAGMTYSRTLLLHTNAFPQTYSIPLQIRTANLPIRSVKFSLYPVLLLFVYILISSRILFWMALPASLSPEAVQIVSLGLGIGSLLGIQGAAWTLDHAGATSGSRLTSSTAIFFGIPVLINIWFFLENLIGSWDSIISGLIPGALGGWLLGLGMGIALEKLLVQMVMARQAIGLILLTSLLAICMAFGLTTGFSNPVLVFAITIFSIALGSLLINAPLNHAKKIADFRKLERNRIRP